MKYKKYSEIAKKQNMTIARAKAIDIMVHLQLPYKGMKWYKVEDVLSKIISCKWKYETEVSVL